MGLPGKVKAGVLAGLLVLGSIVIVHAEESYETLYHVPPGKRENYTLLVEDLGEYEVREGDCLWGISEKFLGNGSDYQMLAEQNPDVITDPDLIYPGMRLQLKRNVYVRKRTGTNGLKTPEYRFGVPADWSFGILEAGDVFANCSFSGDGVEAVVCLIRAGDQAGDRSLSDWERSRKTIEAYVRKNYAKQVSDLSFHHYRSESGTEIYLISYVCTIDMEPYGYWGNAEICVCDAICRTEHIQAEFTGFDMQGDIQDIVRFMAAGFEELVQGEFTLNDYNITLAPSEAWELPGIHNPFVWVEEYFDAVFRRVFDTPEETKDAKERILGREGTVKK